MDEFDDRTTTLPGPSGTSNGNGNGSKVVPFPEKKRRFGRRRRERKIRVRKFRVLIVLFGLGVLAIVSTAFGMLMAVASDLPKLEAPAYRNSVILSHDGR